MDHQYGSGEVVSRELMIRDRAGRDGRGRDSHRGTEANSASDDRDGNSASKVWTSLIRPIRDLPPLTSARWPLCLCASLALSFALRLKSHDNVLQFLPRKRDSYATNHSPPAPACQRRHSAF